MPRECRPPGLPGRLESSTLSLLPTEVSLQCHLHRPFGEQGAAIRLAQAAGVSRWNQAGGLERPPRAALPPQPGSDLPAHSRHGGLMEQRELG